MIGELRVQGGGDGEPALLLLHGLGATGDVWSEWASLLDSQWPGRWLAPDLPGHGGSDPLPRYSFGAVAAGVANLVRPDERLVVLGHSMGGVVGLALASGWFGVQVDTVAGLGIKVSWTADELARVSGLAQRPVAWFDSYDDAAARYLRVSGLTGLLAPGSPATRAGVVEDGGHWRLAQDPPTFAVGAPDMAGLLVAARATVILARGEHDQMVTDEQLAELGAPATSLPGLGHNAHVEDPAAVLRLLEPALR